MNNIFKNKFTIYLKKVRSINVFTVLITWYNKKI